MRRRAQRAGVYLVPLTAVWFSCSVPEMVNPGTLEAVYLPFAGASGVALDVEPGLYFSGDVDAGSVTDESVYLESGVLDYNTTKAKWVCQAPWEPVNGQPKVNQDNAQMVVLVPEAFLEIETCYRLVCTTAVKGVTLGPLRDARVPDMPAVGAVQVFSTGLESGPVPPTVRITSPADRANFQAPAEIVITVEAADRNGTVEKVEFFEGSNKLGEDISAPYETNWSSVPAGNFTLTAQATDNDGVTGISDPVDITVTSSGRVTNGLVALYTFEGSGSTVPDVSGVGTALDLTIANTGAVQWITGGLSVNTDTVIESSGPATKIIDACMTSNEVTLEAWFTPHQANFNSGPVATISSDRQHRNITLDQFTTSYRGQVRTTSTDQDAFPSSITTAGDSAAVELTHVVYLRDNSGTTRIYFNGDEQENRVVEGDFSTWNASYPLALANEPSEDAPWLGELYLVAVYDRTLEPNEVAQNFYAGP